MSSLADLSQSIKQLLQMVKPSVVKVEAGRWMGSTGIVWSKEGEILTAAHAIKRSDVQVEVAGHSTSATLVGRDPAVDVALLKADFEPQNLPSWLEDSALELGEMVLALGWPGQNLRATLGMISNVGAEWRTPMGGRVAQYLQPDVTLYPGFSGGPLMNPQGQFIGMNTQALRRGLPLTLTPPTLRQAVECIKAGTNGRGYLGVGVQPVQLPEGGSQPRGLLLISVEPGSPAAKAGLMLGDVLLKFNSQPLARVHQLLGQLADVSSGVAQLEVWRGGSSMTVSVEVAARG